MKNQSPPPSTPPAAALLKKLHLADKAQNTSFHDLYRDESAALGKPLDLKQVEVTQGTGGEPWVKFTAQDRFGLALSGGGIRSATFNLGVLQSLDQLGVLKHLDYLATVSGGGYVGGFWTAWLQREKNRNSGKKFPRAAADNNSECAEVRHLREFSRFLLPGMRVLGTEFWNIIMTVLGGMLPSLTAATSVLVLLWFGWIVLLGGLLAEPTNVWRAWMMLVFVCLYFIGSEFSWPKKDTAPATPAWKKYSTSQNIWDFRGYTFCAAVACAMVIAGWFLSRNQIPQLKLLLDLKLGAFEMLKYPVVGFCLAALFGSVALALMTLRAVIARAFTTPDGISFLVGIERTVTRMLRLAVIMLGFATLWWIASELEDDAFGKSVGGNMLPATGASTAVSTGLFLWVRKWLSEPPKETNGGNLLSTLFNTLKRATPKVLATLTWLLLFVLVGVGVAWWLQANDHFAHCTHCIVPGKFWWLPLACVAQLILMVLLYDPERMGMHELYRSRISRCYLGASNVNAPDDATEAERAEKNRTTSEDPQDDIRLGEFKPVAGPIHLVCTAANDLSGDPVGTLYRGAKSAVLSMHGISIGDRTAKLDKLRFSSAITASAAAFNSQMGRYSMDLGPAVTFLMTAFNLRLGLWVPHPDNSIRWNYSLPGRFFFYELLGISKADGKNLLLSDGGHFENFGLYELIRRHCRYIIVSDCGSDLEAAFDDLANVLRRVREDFGVEVELDVSRLNPDANGFSSQHAAIGTIHYNGLGGMDKGTLLFVKPSLTGEEPPDVLQYRTRNRAFPHESTANQFYDEPQWESYRRLGAHIGRVVFEFLDKPERSATTVDNIFRYARSYWYALPENLSERFIEMSARCAEMGENLSSGGPVSLRREFFPETSELVRQKDPDSLLSNAPPSPDEELQVLEFLIRVIQMMEDVWVSGDFERYWSHPLNEGWMNYFHRWASTPSFRRWWPVLSPIYSFGFRNFVQERFALGSVDSRMSTTEEETAKTAKLELFALGNIDNVANLGTNQDYQSSNAWRFFKQSRRDLATDVIGKNIFGYSLRLFDRNGQLEPAHLWVGFVLVHESPGEHMADWHATDFFVPQMLHGGNIVSNLLDALIRHYKKNSTKLIHELRVNFGPRLSETVFLHSPQKVKDAHKSQGLAAAARYERVRQIEFYKSRGFHYHHAEDTDTGAISLHLELGGHPH